MNAIYRALMKNADQSRGLDDPRQVNHVAVRNRVGQAIRASVATLVSRLCRKCSPSSRTGAHRRKSASRDLTAFHSSVIVALHPPSLPVLNCASLIFSASSIPEIVSPRCSIAPSPAPAGFVAALFDGPAPPGSSSTGWIEPLRDWKFAVCFHLPYRSARGRVGVQGDLRGYASVLHRAAEIGFGSVYVPVPAEEQIHGLACFVDRAVQVLPVSVNLIWVCPF
jgi:hypothetical protein